MEIRSLTPLAEYIDLIYGRCVLQLNTIEGLKWRIELRPPTLSKQETGTIRIHGVKDHKIINTSADMHAIQIGASVSLEAMITVADFHIERFIKLLTKRDVR